MPCKEFREYERIWDVAGSDNGTIGVDFTSEEIVENEMVWSIAKALCNPNYQAWVVAGQPEKWDFGVIEFPDNYYDQVIDVFDRICSEPLHSTKTPNIL